MGSIIYWGLLRFTIVLVSMWVLRSHIEEYGDWWGLFFLAVGVVVLYPAQIAWQRHRARVKIINNNVLCVTCKHYDAQEALCTALDELVTSEIVPCQTLMWEPK